MNDDKSYTPPIFIAVWVNSLGHMDVVGLFKTATELEDFSQTCYDPSVFIYRLGTDFLVDGHTEASKR
jgi:hypothetical protein